MERDPEDSPPLKRRKWVARFTFGQKFSVICFLFVASLIVSAVAVLRSKNQAIYATDQQRKQLTYFRPVVDLIQHAVEYSFAIHKQTQDYPALEHVLNYHKEHVKKGIAHLETEPLPAEYTGTVGLDNSDIAAVSQSWQRFQEASPEELKELHSELMNSLHHLAKESHHSSLMITLFRMDHYYLESLLYDQIPAFQKALLKLSIQGQALLTDPVQQQEDYDRIVSEVTDIRNTLQAVEKSAENAMRARQELGGSVALQAALEIPLRELQTSTMRFVNYVQDALLEPNPGDTESADSFFFLAAQALSSSFKLPEVVSDELNLSLKGERDLLVQRRNVILTVILSVGLLTLALSLALVRSMFAPLRELVAVSEQLANGNLSQRVPEGGHDEIATVARSINQMAESIEHLLKQLQRSGIQLTSSTNQIAASAHSQEATIVQQEAATKQIAVMVKQISATTEEFARHLTEATASSAEASKWAEEGQEALEHLKALMDRMVDSSHALTSTLTTLEQNAAVITDIITTITKVADRSNLLSLNTAIEAHKLGKHGGSIRVIAREIRRLADQTAYATLHIDAVITEMVNAVTAMVNDVHKFHREISSSSRETLNTHEVLSQIISRVRAHSETFASINQQMEQQHEGTRQITESIQELSESAQSNSESIRQFRHSVEELTSALKEMRFTVNRVQKRKQTPIT